MTKVHFERDDHSYHITLDDPPLHILDIAMLEELRDAISRIKDDRHCMIIASTGDRAFSAGASVQDHMGDRVATMLARFHDCFRMLARLDIVTVALVRGAALGGGCELALACDFVLAGEHARFGQPEINLGVFPPVAAWQLSRQAPPRKGLELLLTGDPIDAATAERLGLVNAL
ncbi:MAG: enoyl-CoA hydratase/isomerase family protein, partial [Thermoanaerobaculia bacterium]